MRKRATEALIRTILAVTGLALYATPAFAQQYNGGEVGGEGILGGGVGGVQAHGGTTVVGWSGVLPFTGAELTLYALAGAAILAAGVLLRRASADR